MTRALEGSQSFDIEFRIVRPDGDIRYVHVIDDIVRDESGKPIRLFGAVQDITERKQAEEALVHSEQQYRTILNETQTGFFISEPGGNLLEFNQALIRMFGFQSAAEANQTNVKSLYRDGKDREALIEKLQIEKKVVNYPIERVHRSGSILYTVGNMIGEFDKQGKLTRIVGFLYDDTERRKIEQQFIQVQKMEGLGSLASGIAHDFNNILGIILGHISLIGRQRSDPEKFAQSKEAIEKAATRGASLVRQLLTFARKSDVIIQLISVNDLISELVKLFHETFPKLIEVVTDLDPKVPPLTADPTQLHQVFLNLCVNARDAMPQGGRLKITTTFWSGDSLRRLYPQAGSGEYVKIDVADTGEGMDEDTRKRIFEPFFTTKGVGKGTGLGLSTVFGIVESHHGFIDVESEVGKGTTFRIFFPVQRKTRETVDINKQVGEVTGGSETILFVEDEDALRELVKVVLITKGYTVLTANDGAEAINVYEKNHSEVKLVLTDLGLPILSGQEVVRKLNQINNSVKILIASGFLDPEVKSEMFKWGVKGFVQKPYQPDELLRTIRKVLDGS